MYHLTQRRSRILKLLGVVLALAIISELLKVIFQTHSVSNELATMTEAINKKCPLIVDNMTRLDNSTATSNKQLHLTYTLINNHGANVDTIVLKQNLSTSFIRKLKSDPMFKNFKHHGVSVLASYYDSAGVYVCSVMIHPNQF